MPVGRPPAFETSEELQAEIDSYFTSIEGDFNWVADPENPDKDIKEWTRLPEPATITGLTLFLGFESRQSFYDYGKKPTFTYTIKRAHLMIENKYEQALNFSRTPTAQIFALKNLGWSDRQDIDLKSNVHISDEPITFE